MTSHESNRTPTGTYINIALIAGGIVLILALVLGRLIAGDGESAEPLDIKLAFEPVARGLEDPVLLIGAGDGSGDRFIVERAGRIQRLDSNGELDAEPLLDISDRVLSFHERGLLGLAFHPAFDENGRFFVTYSREGDGATSVSEFTIATPDPDADEAPEPIEATERPLLVIPQPYKSHKGGMLAFDSDGMLIISTGDGGHQDDPFKNGQDPASLLAKLLRIDVDSGWPYGLPADNGFADAAGARPEVHAIGLRNPWRFSLDRASGDLIIGDVGQREWEEIDVLPADITQPSFGWSEMEGSGCFDDRPCQPNDHIRPAISYGHVDGDTGHCAVVGGYAYRGSTGSLPDGTYLYGDFCSGTVWGVPVAQLAGADASPAVVAQLDPTQGQIHAFGEDDDGELYLLTSAGDAFAISTADRPA